MSMNDVIHIIDGPMAKVDAPRRPWRVLVADDDPEVLAVTRLSLKGAELLNRPVELLEARSAAEARLVLQRYPDVAVILLDVVMESPNAGLRLVPVIREELGMREVRIILRTGEPGYAPERRVIQDYDINDYKTKGELNHARLLTALTAALRAYKDISHINDQRLAAERLVGAAARLQEHRSVVSFSQGVIQQVAEVLQQPACGLLCVREASGGGAPPAPLEVLHRCGDLALSPFSGDPLGPTDVAALIHRALAARAHIFDVERAVLYLQSPEREGALYLQCPRALRRAERQFAQVFATNISACLDNVERIEQLRKIASTDALTGLPNRAGFLSCVEALHESDDIKVALIGLSGLQEISDSLGREVGEEALRALAQRLRHRLDAGVVVARTGDETFALAGAIPQLDPKRLLALVEEPLNAGGWPIPLTFHVGLCRRDASKPMPETLLKRASMALQAARRSRTPERCAWFEASMEQETREKLRTAHSLKVASGAGELRLFYQPQIDLRTGAVVSMEALLRWPSSGGAPCPPSVFIPLAESSGLIHEIGRWALITACGDLAQLVDEDIPAPARVAVNVSQLQVRSAGFVDLVKEALREAGLRPDQLELEITESVVMDEPATVIQALTALRELGVRLAMDDFGTGYSSLSYLRQLPIHALKIDRAFVQEIADGAGVLAEAILRLGTRLDLEVVAEGVETEGQEIFLRAQGCPLGQGYRYARPMPLADLRGWLTREPVGRPRELLGGL